MVCQIVSSLAFQRLYSFSSDYSMLTKDSGSSLVILVVYVDTILLTGVDVSDISSLKAFLDDQFKIKKSWVL